MGGSQKRKGDKFSKDKYTIEVMLDQPCKFHSVSGKPGAYHSPVQFHQRPGTREPPIAWTTTRPAS
jgi:hypothetical protein